uniref:NADH dehydrogenase subunit 6 n=1 Tax=Linyphia triangularis TaxID=94031 RepID=A0A7L7S5K6_LINTI|nr:NADH dehydrogenase subunit 6 [Linyphia triangularis]
MKISLMLGLIFILSNQPMLMIGILMMLVCVYSLFIYYSVSSFWFGYILILVLLSGVLVIFSYVVSLIPNESFEVLSLMLLLVSFIYLFFLDFFYAMVEDLSFSSLLIWESLLSGYLMYLVMFLLGIMVMVVYVSTPFAGALRVF